MKTLNLIALLLFIAASVAVFMLDTPTTRTVQSKVMAIFAPFMHASATVENTTSRAIAEDIDPKELLRETEALRSRVAGRALRRFLIGPWTLPTEHVEIATFTRLPLAHDCSRTLKLGWV